MKFNYLDAGRARNMRRRRLSTETILEFFAGKYTTASEIDELIAGIRDRNTKYRKQYCKREIARSKIETENRPTIPNEVIAQRDIRVMLQPRSITALLCGDPLPGQSALDRRL